MCMKVACAFYTRRRRHPLWAKFKTDTNGMHLMATYAERSRRIIDAALFCLTCCCGGSGTFPGVGPRAIEHRPLWNVFNRARGR